MVGNDALREYDAEEVKRGREYVRVCRRINDREQEARKRASTITKSESGKRKRNPENPKPTNMRSHTLAHLLTALSNSSLIRAFLRLFFFPSPSTRSEGETSASSSSVALVAR